MLISCPECELQVSDKASSCPHCGLPLAKISKKPKTKKLRLPNGFGRITKINNPGLRNPYRAMVTTGMDENGKFKCKILKPQGYFSSYNDAYTALVEYHKNPYDLDDETTVKDLYEKWSEEYFEKISASAKRTVTSAWAYCSDLYDMRAKDIRARHIKGVIENGKANIKGDVHTASPAIKSRIKSLFNMMFDYALEYELVDKNYARTFNISDNVHKEMKESTKTHMDFTDQEMKILWDNVDNFAYVDALLIQAYSGWRPQELGLIEISNVDLENWTFTGGMKTDAGRNRTVPIHTKIRPLVEKKYNEAIANKRHYLITCDGKKMTYDMYKNRYRNIISGLQLNSEHRPHDPRKQFITMAKKAGVDDYAIKILVGHSISDITEGVYTNRDIEWLRKDIEKIQ